MSFGQYFELVPPVPVGFVALLKLFAKLSSDPEWPLQLLPILCAVAQVPLIAVLARRSSQSRSLGLLAAALLAVCPTLLAYAAHVKQYASDSLIVILLLILGIPLLDVWRPARAAWLALGGVGALLFSFPSIFVSFSLLNLSFARALVRRGGAETALAKSVAVALGYNLGILTLYLALLSGQANQEMHSYWSGCFLPLDSAGAAVDFLAIRGGRALAGAFPGGAPSRVVFALAAALAAAVWVRRTRMIGLWIAVFYLELVVASGLGLYPLGAGRTDIFSYPVTILLIVLGADLVLRRLRATAARPVFAALALVLVLVHGQSRGYQPSVEHAKSVARLQNEVRDGASLLLYHHASFAVAYYSDWPIELRSWDEYAHGFEVAFRRPRTAVLPKYSDLRAHADDLRADVTRLLPDPGDRLVYYATDYKPWLSQLLRKTIEGRGYRGVSEAKAMREELVVYRKLGDL
jgi:hypothetical protein